MFARHCVSRMAFIGKYFHTALLSRFRRMPKDLDYYGGRYWDRTSGPCRVKAVLYR